MMVVVQVEINKVKDKGPYDFYEFSTALEPLVESVYRFSYSPPYKLAMFTDKTDVSAFLQLQNGGWPYKLVNSVQMPEGWKYVGSNVGPIDQKDGAVIYDNIVDKDIFLNFNYAR